MSGPLEGVKVLEFTEIIAGPFGGLLLADMGADVIKVEPPWGEPWRFIQQVVPNEGRQYMSLNRGKRCLTLNLKKPEAQEVVYRLMPDTDVVVLNARPDVPRSLGIDYETLSEINPRLVYCSNTAFGTDGPWSRMPGYDIVAQGVTGLMTSEGKLREDDLPEQIVSTAVADYATGLAMAWGVSAALFHRERAGRGQKLETSLLGSALAVQGGRFIEVDARDKEARDEFREDLVALRQAGVAYRDLLERHSELHSYGSSPYYRTYQASDGVMVVACLSNPLRMRMADVLGLDDPTLGPDYDPSTDEARRAAEFVLRQAKSIIAQKTVDEWLSILRKAGVPAGPVKFIEELVNDPQVAANNLLLEMDHPLAGKHKMVGPFIEMTDTPLKPARPAPALGEHTDEVLSGAGFSPEDIERLRRDGVV